MQMPMKAQNKILQIHKYNNNASTFNTMSIIYSSFGKTTCMNSAIRDNKVLHEYVGILIENKKYKNKKCTYKFAISIQYTWITATITTIKYTMQYTITASVPIMPLYILQIASLSIIKKRTSSKNKWSKNFYRRPHRHLVTPFGGKWIRLTLTPSNTWFYGPTSVSAPNSIPIGSAIFAWFAPMPHTEYGTCYICCSRPHLCDICDEAWKHKCLVTQKARDQLIRSREFSWSSSGVGQSFPKCDIRLHACSTFTSDFNINSPYLGYYLENKYNVYRKEVSLYFAYNCQILTDFQNYFIDRFSSKL